MDWTAIAGLELVSKNGAMFHSPSPSFNLCTTHSLLTLMVLVERCELLHQRCVGHEHEPQPDHNEFGAP